MTFRLPALLFPLLLVACGSSTQQGAEAEYQTHEACPDNLMRYGEGCVRQEVVAFMTCTEKRGINRDILEKSVSRSNAGANVGVRELVDLGVVANNVQEQIKVDRSTPTENDCVIIQYCAKFADPNAPSISCSGQTPQSELMQRGYPETAVGLAQALAAGDDVALGLFSQLPASSSMAADALRRLDGTKEEGTVAQRYFEVTRNKPAPLKWLVDVLSRKKDPLDPNVRVPHGPLGDEALLNVAARAANVDATLALLDAGANPHSYQRLDDWALADPRFLVPLGPLLGAKGVSSGQRSTLVEAFLKHGVVVPHIPALATPSAPTYGPIAADTVHLKNNARVALGTELAETPNLCSPKAASSTEQACRRARARYGVDWCKTVRDIPRVIGEYQGAVDPVVPPFLVRYFLGADADAGYFLVEELTYYSGYALLETDPEMRRMSLLRYTKQRPYGAGECIGDVDRTGFCWRRHDLTRDASSGVYHNQYGPPMKTSRSCQAAEASAQARVREIAPKAFTHPDQRVVACVNDIRKTPTTNLLNEATRFDILSHNRLGPRECVLAYMKTNLISGNLTQLQHPNYVTAQAKFCCEKSLGLN